MKIPSYVHWHEGLFLRPQHLQMLQRCILDTATAERGLHRSFPYGIIYAELDDKSLEDRVVRFSKLQVVMKSGLVVSYPDGANLPTLNIQEALNATSDPLTVCLAVPDWGATRANTIDKPSDKDAQSGRIYRIDERDCADENTGQNEQPVQVRKINARLELLTHDPPSDVDMLPILKVDKGMSENNVAVPRPYPDYIPPLMYAWGHPPLASKVRELKELVSVARRRLNDHLRVLGSDLRNLTLGVQFDRWERLRVLNSYMARLPTLLAAPAVTPVEIYLELRRFQGEMAAFYPGRPEYFDCPDYNHDDLSLSFHDLFRQLENMVPVSAGADPLIAKFGPEVNRMRLADMTQEFLTRPTKYYLAIETNMNQAELDKLVTNRDLFKLMARSRADYVVYGLLLEYVRYIPPDLVFKQGRHYFLIDRGSSDRSSALMWDAIRVDRQIAVKWPDMARSDFSLSIYMTVPGDS